ncbi:lysylphosphatidylglycerol synthase transmembrane domain-containing protein [Haloarculaceae archaeon H-GB2-1]|nr:lysylphosphatidylglycerol synthase transmembrane domain-containing protein [Haloarculaceae archaeon H-GB1-1]MEA5388230.1 lysylphosphatidylglycerol synthase transmembrane domain-containing protein [Haloarculaceae archaeon H-GB11]MEA5406252.1 lysylphosphatidylglycerol synthase transmembrane domain-containing protein [Haloarculaceae archaeon H-GB2-1]
MTDDGAAVLDFADRATLLKIGLGFAVSVVLLYLLAVGVGLDAIKDVLARADPRWLALGALSTAVCLLAWAKAWDVVLGVVGVDVSFRQLVVTYYAATFANYVTPLGQAGGEPFIAYVLSRDTGASYEDSLASVVTADLLNLMPFFSFAAIGFATLVVRTTLPDKVEPLAAGLVVLAVGIPALAAGGWRYRYPLGRLFLRLVAPISRRTSLVSLESIRERMTDLNEAFQRIATEPRSLGYALGFSYVGWVFFALPLYFAGLTIGVPIDLLLVFFIVPASTLAGMVPSPGGLGGVEVALVALLVALTSLTGAGAYAVAIVYRLASYWFALGAGGAAALFVIRRS